MSKFGIPAPKVQTTHLSSSVVGLTDNTVINDAYSRLRISQPTSIFISQCLYNSDPLQLETGTSGTGLIPSYSINTRMTEISVASGSGECWIQSYQYSPYQPGKSQLIYLTCVPSTPVSGAILTTGYGDSLNGIFYRQNGIEGYEFIRRSTATGITVDEVVGQSNWNIDTFSNSNRNPSGIILDGTKDTLLAIDLQFLSMGRVRCGFIIGGILLYGHEFQCSNILTIPFMQQASLPVSMYLTSSAIVTKSAYWKCSTVISEGGKDNLATSKISTPQVTGTAGNDSRVHLLSIRPLQTFNGVMNRSQIIFDSLNLLVTGAQPIFWELVIGATFSSPVAWNNVNTTYSGVEYADGGTLSGVLGPVIASGYVSAGGNNKESIVFSEIIDYPITLDRAGNTRAMGTLSLLVSGVGGTSACRGSMILNELR